MPASPHLLFESSRFAVRAGEDEETNPGIFGKSLAHWLGQQLVSPTFSVDDVIAEDFGWCVPIPDERMRVYLACSSTDENHNEWRVFVFAEGALLGRLFGRVKPPDVVAQVYTKLSGVLRGAAGVSNLREEAN
jgi:hypothetical protein